MTLDQKFENALQEIVMSCLDTSRTTFNRCIKEAKNHPDKFKKINMKFTMDEKTLNDLKNNVGFLEKRKGKSVKDYLRLRALKKIVIQKELSLVFCPLAETFIENMMLCHISCSFGHMSECHFPYDCSSEYCNHYASERNWEQEMGVPKNNSDGLYHFKLLIYNLMEEQKKSVKSTFNDNKNIRG